MNLLHQVDFTIVSILFKSLGDKILRFLINQQNGRFQVNALLNQQAKSIVSGLDFVGVFAPLLVQFFLTLEISGVALLHILIDTF